VAAGSRAFDQTAGKDRQEKKKKPDSERNSETTWRSSAADQRNAARQSLAEAEAWFDKDRAKDLCETASRASLAGCDQPTAMAAFFAVMVAG
jgi:hypothetical protein